MKIFIAKVNADQTEGRGPMRPVGYFLTAEAAYNRVKGEGVMGVGDGEVYELTVAENDTGDFTETIVYGYHNAGARGTGQWRRGWVDGRDLPKVDPEYAEYLRLQRKFQGKGIDPTITPHGWSPQG